MRAALAILLLLAAVLALTAPALAKKAPKVEGPAIKFGMELKDAEAAIADPALWRVAYRIDTENTCEIACTWKDTVFYLARFYQGRCYYVEKRAKVPKADVDHIVSVYNEKYGATPDASQDRDGKLIYARWSLPDRDISLTASRGGAGLYKLMYEEEDPIIAGQARVAQETELAQMPTETDPLTGHQRLVKPNKDDSGAGDSSSDGSDSASSDDSDGTQDSDQQPDDSKDKDKHKDDQGTPDEW